MEDKYVSKARPLSADMISTLPQSIMETILCLIPTEEAARTSILSREWRYKWTTVPKLVFTVHTTSKGTIVSEENLSDLGSQLFSAVLQVLSLRQGPIHEFTLRHYGNCQESSEIDQIILQLSRNHTVKKLSLTLHYYKLPLCAYSLHQLTDLYLKSVEIFDEPILNGFPGLRRLCLTYVDISTKALLHLLSNCPSLKSFTLLTESEDLGYQECTILELFECLPVIERLTTSGWTVLGWLVLDSVLPQKLPATLIHLKYFRLGQTWFADDCLRFLLALFKCSPNLEKIRLEIDIYHIYDNEVIYSSILEEYSDVRLEHLNELVIKDFNNFKPELEFVKFILTRSPKLKKVRISSEVRTEEQLEILETLVEAPHASPVEFIVM